MHVEGLLPDYLCLVTLLNSEQNEQFERFCCWWILFILVGYLCFGGLYVYFGGLSLF